MAQAMPGDITQFEFEVSGISFAVLEFKAAERISTPYNVDLVLVSEDDADFEGIIGQEAFLKIIGEVEDRYFHGIVTEFAQTGAKGRFLIYEATLAPAMWLLTLEQDCRIFQEKTVQEIIETILEDANIAGDRYEFRLQNEYEPRTYCVQYRESDFDFISRLMEEEGIFYFFEHRQEQHVIVFGDSDVNYMPIPGGSAELEFFPPDAMVTEPEFITAFSLSRKILSGKVTHTDYNFEKPSLDLNKEEEADQHATLERYDYPGKYSEPGPGKKRAEVRLQESMAYLKQGRGTGVCPRFGTCLTFSLAGHSSDAFNAEYLLVDVVHDGYQPQVLEEFADSGASFHYLNSFMCIPKDVTFRPERRTPKARVEGVQTAIVVGPPGEEIYPDAHGRVKVQFHWDREGQNDENSSCWIRVSQLWAGVEWGAMHIPRIGQEVVVSFEEGDPDRPLITGRVYHGTNLPPYPLPDEKTKSTIRSETSLGGGSHNELMFEDLNGQTRVELSNAYGHKLTQDEADQYTRIETRDQHIIHMDDKEQHILAQTTNAHKVFLDDANEVIRIESTGGHVIELDDANARLRVCSTSGHTAVFDDGNKKIEIVTKDGHSLVMDDDNTVVSMTTIAGHTLTLDDADKKITLMDSSGGNMFQVDIGGGALNIYTDMGDINLLADMGDINMQAKMGNISIKADMGNITLEAPMGTTKAKGLNVESEATARNIVKGMSINVEATAVNTITGTPIKLN